MCKVRIRASFWKDNMSPFVDTYGKYGNTMLSMFNRIDIAQRRTLHARIKQDKTTD